MELAVLSRASPAPKRNTWEKDNAECETLSGIATTVRLALGGLGRCVLAN